MPRNMSFMLTTEQVKQRSKTVTRRLGWWNLRPGELVNACEKCQGLGKGGKIVRLGLIRIVGTVSEPLCQITQADVVREGFPQMTPAEFVEFFCRSHKAATANTIINRIEFEYVD